ncbi:MAG: DUF1045 domain-containing protein [Limimaricola sp.]|uniref:DUF1045 domain-containing protein n=1 Tax=Limimaricola sp. TaxID=2211665 RepID=UPI001D9B9530|nr:DUF1045 domain-containing protein [Limimaricola sp.]MBI1416458.1 DUF1045 domain-containing protein [Limimaricola sp.]
MSVHSRFALYFAPPPGPLADFGAAWLGWDIATGQAVAHPDVEGLPRPLAEITATPRRYGFHATLKPPFRLAPGQTETALAAEVAALAAGLAPATLDGLQLAQIGRFLALVPEGEVTALNALAGRLVEGLDHFRAPAPPEEIARRRAAGLSPAQDALLVRWGYPYVMEEFRFHMTLTGPLDPDTGSATRAALAPHLAAVLPRPFLLDEVVLAGERADGHFETVHRYALSG